MSEPTRGPDASASPQERPQLDLDALRQRARDVLSDVVVKPYAEQLERLAWLREDVTALADEVSARARTLPDNLLRDTAMRLVETGLGRVQRKANDGVVAADLSLALARISVHLADTVGTLELHDV